MKPTRKTITGRLAVTAAVLTAATLTGTGTAMAQSSAEGSCRGMSPNIIDFPYAGAVLVSQSQSDPGAPFVNIKSGGSLWGDYETQVTLNWTNLTTGASGSETQSRSVGFILGKGASITFNPHTGAGVVRTDFSVRNTGLVTQHVSCSKVSDVW
ncbi:hypothetical protein [Nocardia sp. CNY236]|uniref:hypothetical protein n=1 Tax=Nocardia sp. CNY236 TaxID=1169152 RepID=UPI0018C903B9|nr:hypothetical protein [Nocardia sp. CNY236]